jgi:aminotransferase
MTRLSLQQCPFKLAQAVPDFPAHAEIKAAAQQAILDDLNQYPITWGVKPFRDAICASYKRFHGLEIDPEREVTVCCGATEGMISTLLALIDPGDEVIIFEPFYENYWPDSQLTGASCRYVRLHEPDWTFSRDELRAAFTKRTRAVILNSPNNPTGSVFSLEQLQYIGELCEEYDCLLITDEIYEHVIFGGRKHIPPMTLGALRKRCVSINSLSKTFSVTGWRVGWVIAPPELTSSVRKVNDFLTEGAATPLQHAGITALRLPDSYFPELARNYETKRNTLMGILEKAGFHCYQPNGAYYVMCDASALKFKDDITLCCHLIENVGIAAVPGSSFFSKSGDGSNLVRFCFAKKPETLEAAAQKLKRL